LKNKKIITLFLMMLLAVAFTTGALSQQQRFPKPEFETGYEQPQTYAPSPRAPAMEWVDISVLILVMGLTTWMIFSRRSRKGIFWIMVFALLYFGFYRLGCICAIGAVQNVSLGLSTASYTIPLTALAFFAIPLGVSLFAGRVFCGSACPLGAIQDVMIVKPIRIAPWLQTTLGLFPFIYLGLAVLYAATGTDFIICRFDPFIGIFRMGAEFHLIVLGIGFLLLGMFVARPYCRFVCPYGAMLNVGSQFSKKHLTITPKECINCNLCKDACPFGAIRVPTTDKENKPQRSDTQRFILYALLIPVFVLAGGWVVSSSHKILAKAHPDVALASTLTSDPSRMNDKDNLDITTFMASERTLEMLVADAAVIQDKFRIGGWWLGAFLGLVFSFVLLNQVIFRRREFYEIDRGECLSCGRCMKYCPVGNPAHPYHKEHQAETDKPQLA
jgi:NosR/NirI family transcriptional regulator, nitrous oxide reductase regulator